LETSPSSATTSPRIPPSAVSASPYALRVASWSPTSQEGSSPPEAVSNECGLPASGAASETLRSRSPPSSSIAASGSSSGLPCLPGWSSTALTPLPFFVRATITVGRPVVFTASSYAPAIASTSWPSIAIACQPNASARRT
jgi:hypothetical protein